MSATPPSIFYQPDSTVYSDGDKRGVIILILCSCVSCVAVIGLLGVISTSAFRANGYRGNLFFKSCFFACFVFLLLCNLIQGIASIISIIWIQKMAVMNGQACFFQGLLTQLADLGIAIWILIISGLALCHQKALLKKAADGTMSWAVFVCGWLMIAALLTIGPITVDPGKGDPFYAASSRSCWISPHHKFGQIVLDRLIMSVVVLLCPILCFLVLLRLGRTKNLAEERGALPGTDKDDATNYRITDLESAHFSKMVLVYPIGYIIYSLPLLIAQFVSWGGHDVSFKVSILCMAVYLLSGFANVMLFIVIQRSMCTDQYCLGESSLHDGESGLGCKHFAPCGHKRSDSNASDVTLVAEVKKKKLRPPEIIITRDSFETIDSMYSLHEEDLRSGRVSSH